jgi:hypothetical protein
MSQFGLSCALSFGGTRGSFGSERGKGGRGLTVGRLGVVCACPRLGRRSIQKSQFIQVFGSLSRHLGAGVGTVVPGHGKEVPGRPCSPLASNQFHQWEDHEELGGSVSTWTPLNLIPLWTLGRRGSRVELRGVAMARAKLGGSRRTQIGGCCCFSNRVKPGLGLVGTATQSSSSDHERSSTGTTSHDRFLNTDRPGGCVPWRNLGGVHCF